jgi:thioredoxin reductase
MYDVIIVGGGPAGLSAALVLGRCRRSVLVCDDGRYRNEASVGLHGFLSRDGIHPSELRRIGREQLARYEVEYRRVSIADALALDGSFDLITHDGERLSCRKLLLATGVSDCLPQIEGVERFYGTSVFHCPYCDGWEMRDQPLAVHGRGKNAMGLSLTLKTWSDDVVLCTDGPAGLRAEEAARLAVAGIPVREERIARLQGVDDILQEIVFQDGSTLPRRGLFFSAGQSQRSGLVAKLGCDFTRKGTVRTGRLEGTNVPGLYVAGDASKDVQLTIVAAAEGAKAAIAIDAALREDMNAA